MEDVLPFVVTMMITCLDTSVMTIIKAAMNEGVFTETTSPPLVVKARNDSLPSRTIQYLLRFFILGLLGICLFQVRF